MAGMQQVNGTDLENRIDREFLAMPLRPSTMTFYTPRATILRAVKRNSAAFYGSVLDVGCGFMPYRGIVESVEAVGSYTGLDLAKSNFYGEAVPDITWDGRIIPSEDAAFDCVMATEFLEHFSDPVSVLAEIFRVMKPGGLFFATVPFIWNLHEVPHDEFRYTPYSMERLIGAADFGDVRVEPLGGWNMALAQMLGLWVGFSPMRNATRRAMRQILFPLYALLVKTDRVFEGFDGLGRSMFNGLSVTARKPA
jgi:SAM-dependent methyltransferase